MWAKQKAGRTDREARVMARTQNMVVVLGEWRVKREEGREDVG